jgi:hypothetical protein
MRKGKRPESSKTHLENKMNNELMNSTDRLLKESEKVLADSKATRELHEIQNSVINEKIKKILAKYPTL